MNWLELLAPLIEALIQQCLENNSEADISRFIQRGGPRVRLALWRALKEGTELRGRDLASAVNEIAALGQSVSEGEVAEFVGCCKTA